MEHGPLKNSDEQINRMEASNQEREEYYKNIINASKDAIIVLDPKGNISLWNSSAVVMFGYEAQEVQGKNVHLLMAPPVYHDQHFKAFAEFSHTGKGGAMNKTMEIVGLNKQGEEIPIELSLSAIRLADGWNSVGILRNIASRKAAEKALEEKENRLIEAQQMAHVGDWELDLSNNTIEASREAFTIYGIHPISPFLPLEVVKQCVSQEYRQEMDQALRDLITKDAEYDQEFKIIKNSTGAEVHVHSIAKLIRDSNNKAYKVRGTIQDITDWKKKEEEITYLSNHDHLTGLYNRRFFEEELNRLDKARNLPLTIVMGDVNGLKLINDSFGHGMGDKYLKKVAELIGKACRADDIIARLSGDEFAIILPKTNEMEAEGVINRINEISATEKIGAINISISFGYRTKNEQEEDIQVIIKNSEDQMYKNKLYESFSVRSNTIDLIMSTLYEKNNREMLHSQRVGGICKRIAEKMNFDKDNINKMKIAGLMHDIGKIGIDEKILNATRKLSEEEGEQIKKHSEIGYRILSSANEFSEIAEYVLEHQERWDGSGYPKGLKGEEISIQARIIAVADAFDAMTGERPYGKVLTVHQAMQELQKCAGTQFDPEVVKIFKDKVMGEI